MRGNDRLIVCLLAGLFLEQHRINEKYNTFNVPYDYLSVMHYLEGPDPAYPWMVTHDPKYQKEIGRAPTASPGDYRKLCSLYDCRRCLTRPFRRASQSCSPIVWPEGMRTHPRRHPSCATDFTQGACCQEHPHYANVLPARCATCTPEPSCRGEWVATNPGRFHRECCGDCGPKKLLQWCENLGDEARKWWADHGMCIPDRCLKRQEFDMRQEMGIAGNLTFLGCRPKDSCRSVPGTVDESHLRTAKELAEYRNDCCGACGVVWRWSWCSTMEASHAISHWGLQGMCPVSDEDP